MVEIRQNLCSKLKYGIKCPYSMTPTRIVIHNTANDASAQNEISYMIGNNLEVSFHIFSSSLILSFAVPNLLMSPSKAFFISVKSVFHF